MTMDTSSVIASLLALAGTHAGGHMSKAGEYGFSPRMNPGSFTERWEDTVKPTHKEELFYTLDGNKVDMGTRDVPNPAYTPKNALAVHGAGFEAQDNLNRAIDMPESNVANAIYKLLYAAGLTAGRNMNYKGGDVEAIEKLSGNRYTKHMVAGSGIANALGIPLDFTMIEGGKSAGPGVVYRVKF